MVHYCITRRTRPPPISRAALTEQYGVYKVLSFLKDKITKHSFLRAVVSAEIQVSENGDTRTMECTPSLETEKHSVNNTRSSADADKPVRRVYRSVKIIKHGSIRYVRCGIQVSYYCVIVILSVRRYVF